jgi:hypothetical protein
MIWIREQRKVEARIAFEFVAQELGSLMRVDADGEDFDAVAVLARKQRFQLAKLIGAIRSPVAAIEDQHDCFLIAITRERNRLAVLIFEREIGRFLANFEPVEIRCW